MYEEITMATIKVLTLSVNQAILPNLRLPYTPHPSPLCPSLPLPQSERPVVTH